MCIVCTLCIAWVVCKECHSVVLIACLISQDLEALVQYESDRKVDCEVVRQANQHYADPKTIDKEGARDGFLAMFGDQRDFFAGLHQYAGKPIVAGNDKLKKAMYQEFNGCIDSRICNITTSNYGCFETNLETEWEFAANPVTDKTYPGQTGVHTIYLCANI